MIDLKQRINCFSLVIYENDYADFINKITSVNFYSCKYYCICHDKDFNENGELKKLHYHCVIKLDNAISIEKIIQTLDIEILNNNVNVLTIVKNLKAMVRYLIHIDNADKTKYNVSDIFTNDLNINDYFCDNISFSQISQIYAYLSNYVINSLYDIINVCLELRDFKTLEYIENHSYLINCLIRNR